jgi:hypothetical protein
MMMPSSFAKRSAPPQMYGSERTNERYSPTFGDNTYARRGDLSTAKGVVVPTNQQQKAKELTGHSPQVSDQFEPYFGDNTYARREQLSRADQQ